jgi:hypothetical protein
MLLLVDAGCAGAPATGSERPSTMVRAAGGGRGEVQIVMIS